MRSEPLPIQRRDNADGLYVWEATVRFVTRYNMPDNVYDFAVVQAVKNSDNVHVEELRQVLPEEVWLIRSLDRKPNL